MTYTAIFMGLTGVITQFFVVKYLLIRKIRLNTRQFKLLHSLIKKSKNTVIFNEEFNYDNGQLPTIFSGLFKVNNLSLFYLDMNERINQAGWESTTSICEITIPRWGFNKFKKFICNGMSEEAKFVDVFINSKWIGELEIDESIELRKIYQEIEDDFEDIKDGKISKSSFILYGEPGNGKTTLIRDIAKKYGWNIHYFDLSVEMNNATILSLPCSVPDKTIILLEDFDSVFNKRENIKFKGNAEVKFSFDAILNMLDGIYKGKNKIIFALTANDVTKIDNSILNRRSRVKHKINVINPSYSEILSIVNDVDVADLCDGLSMDNVYNIEEYLLNHGKEKTLNKYFHEQINSQK